MVGNFIFYKKFQLYFPSNRHISKTSYLEKYKYLSGQFRRPDLKLPKVPWQHPITGLGYLNLVNFSKSKLTESFEKTMKNLISKTIRI